MPNVDLSFAQDPNTLALAIIYGMIPAAMWLFFWLRENQERKRKTGLLTTLFFGGALMVIVTLPVQEWIATLSHNDNVLNVLWAASEEFLKFAIFAFIILRNSARTIEDPIDYAIYIMVAALGFAGFENALYFLSPLQAGSTSGIILAGSMRFLSTTLLHAASSSLIGIGLGFAYFRSKGRMVLYGFFGFAAAVALHSTFNYFIVQNNEQNFFQVFGFLWVATIVIMILLEQLRRMGSIKNRAKKEHAFFEHIDGLFSGLLKDLNIPVTDTAPLKDLIKAKGLHKNSDLRKFKTLVSSLRAVYIAYLKNQGSGKKAKETAVAVISDSVSAKTIASMIATVKGEVETSMYGKPLPAVSPVFVNIPQSQ